MHRVVQQLIVVVASAGALTALGVSPAAQGAADTDIITIVRQLIAARDWSQAETTLRRDRLLHGTTPEALEALSILARGAFEARKLDKADQYAGEAYHLTVAAQRTNGTDDHLKRALGLAIETQALILTVQGARSNAVLFLRDELERFGEKPLRERVAETLRAVSLEGHAAPIFDAGEHLGPRVPRLDDLKGKVVLLFFWAHWCSECKAESPLIAKMVDKYRSRGLVVLGPTQRYGYVADGRPAPPDKELRYISLVRDSHYRFLREEAVPVGGGVMKAYGIASVPMLVLIDRQGVIRLYHPGRLSEDELDAAIARLI